MFNQGYAKSSHRPLFIGLVSEKFCSLTPRIPVYHRLSIYGFFLELFNQTNPWPNVFFPVNPGPGISSVFFFRTRATKRAIKRSWGNEVKRCCHFGAQKRLQKDPGKACVVFRVHPKKWKTIMFSPRCGGFPSHGGAPSYHPAVLDDHDLALKQPRWLGDQHRCWEITCYIHIGYMRYGHLSHHGDSMSVCTGHTY